MAPQICVALHQGGRGAALIKGLIVVVDLNTLRPKFRDVLGKSVPTSDDWNNVVQCSAVVLMVYWPRRGNDDRCTLALERYLRGNVNTEVLFDNVAFAIDVRHGHEVAKLLPPCDQPHCLASDDGARHTCPCVGGILLSNPVARVKETGAAGANGSDSTKLLCCHHHRSDL
jgi:hypothetical protein